MKSGVEQELIWTNLRMEKFRERKIERDEGWGFGASGDQAQANVDGEGMG